MHSLSRFYFILFHFLFCWSLSWTLRMQRSKRLSLALKAFPTWGVGGSPSCGGRWRPRLPSTSRVGLCNIYFCLSDVTGPEELVFPVPVGGLQKVRGGVI